MLRPPSPALTLRPAAPEDEPFLRALHAETRAPEMAATGWPEELRASFLRGQFDAQQGSYRQRFPKASFEVVLAAGEPAGRLTVARSPGEIRVVEITLTAACRGRGWGTALLERLIAEADRRGVPLRLAVEESNPARRLYHRLGFQETGRDGFYCLLEKPGKVRGRPSPGTG